MLGDSYELYSTLIKDFDMTMVKCSEKLPDLFSIVWSSQYARRLQLFL